jgi:molybdopterin-guanine dinucleotide biosynthesis protein A
VDGRRQPLCARYQPADLDRAELLVAQGRRALADLLAGVEVDEVGPDDWAMVADPGILADVDTPEDLNRLGLAPT